MKIHSLPYRLILHRKEVRAVLLKVRQKPSESVRDALLLSMKALIADELVRNLDPDVKTTVAACLNEIMRISAPVAPYDEEKMKEIFGLIVSSFDNLSNLHAACYSKAVLILENVSKLRSCVMMLDLDCDPLITKMFELFLKNISSDHPPNVLLAMETIMSVMIKESDTVPQELLKVLLASIRKENQDISPVSCQLGTKIIEECSEKLKPYVMETVVSMDTSLDDYAPILSIICKEHDTVKNLDDASAKDVVNSQPSADKHHSAEFVQALKANKRSSKKGGAGTDNKFIGDTGSNSGSTASKKARKQSTFDHNEDNENSSGKGKVSLGNPLSRSKKKNSATSRTEEKAMPGENMNSKGLTENLSDLEHIHQDTPLGDRTKKNRRQSNNNASGVSRSKENTSGSLRKDRTQTSDSSNSKSQRKRTSSDDDVIETPYGRKSYKEDLVGCRIKVWWPLDRRHYEGLITTYDRFAKKHKVDYDDGDEEVLNLRKESWEFTGDELSPDIDLLLDKRKSPSPSDGPQRQGSTEDEEQTSSAHSDEKRGATPDSEARSSDRAHQVTKTVEKSRRTDIDEARRRPDGQKS